MKTKKNYRPDIDGLRALAVMAVILYHFEVWGFSGGYIGVDIFFVISGFLIIRIIMNELTAGTFSLLHFFERRIRRIVPALSAVLLATTAVAYSVLLIPADFMAYGQSLMAQSLFASNWWFMTLSDYFAAPAASMPLLHTWSLAVEEQFYLLFPVAAIGLYPYLKHRFRWVMVFVAVMSFLYSVYLVNVAPTMQFSTPLIPHVWGSATNANAGFYFILPRLWEFMVGGCVAVFTLAIRNEFVAEVLSSIGLLMIVTGIMVFDDATAFPGVAALVPVLGTALLIAANTLHKTSASYLLSLSPVVGVGLLSYSLYLWHWPILSVASYMKLGEVLTVPEIISYILLTFVLAALTYYLVEQPFLRKRYFGSRKAVYAFGGVATLALFILGYGVVSKDGMPERVPKEAQLVAAAIEDVNPRKEECFTRSNTNRDKTEPCLLGMQDPDAIDYVLWGDSHANAVMPAFDAYGKETGRTGIFFGSVMCAPLISPDPITDDERCLALRAQAMEYINETIPPEVYLVSEWTESYAFVGENYGPTLSSLLPYTLSQLPGETQFIVLHRIPTFSDMDYRALFWQIARDGDVFEPVLPRDVMANSVLPHYNQIMTGVAGLANVSTIDPVDTMCDNAKCYYGDENGLYYHDSSHFSVYGAEKIVLPLLHGVGVGQ